VGGRGSFAIANDDNEGLNNGYPAYSEKYCMRACTLRDVFRYFWSEPLGGFDGEPKVENT